METYYALVHKDAESAFGVTFPDLPGCFSASDDEDQVFAAAQSALSLYASDEIELPRARGLAELRSSREIRTELEEGAYLIAVPLITIKKKSRYNLMLPEDLVAGVDESAQTLGVSRSEFVSDTLIARLKVQAGAAVLKQSRDGNLKSEVTSKKVSSTSSKALKSKKAKSIATSAVKSEVTSKIVSSTPSTSSKVLRSRKAKSAAASALTQKMKKE